MMMSFKRKKLKKCRVLVGYKNMKMTAPLTLMRT